MFRCEPTPSVIFGYKSGVPNVLNIGRFCDKIYTYNNSNVKLHMAPTEYKSMLK